MPKPLPPGAGDAAGLPPLPDVSPRNASDTAFWLQNLLELRAVMG